MLPNHALTTNHAGKPLHDWKHARCYFIGMSCVPQCIRTGGYTVVCMQVVKSVCINSDRQEVNPDHDTHLSVDCTDCKIPQKGHMFSSHKFALRSGLRYEFAVGILSGDMKWINGPFPCGGFPDIKIFHASLLTCLDSFERIEADDGYVGESPLRAKVSGAVLSNPREAAAYQKRVQGCHETINARLKAYAILHSLYRRDITQHGLCLSSCCCTCTALH